MHVGRFTAHGRNIFAASQGLIDAFEGTDLDGVTADDIRLPFGAFYVSFADGFDGALPGKPNRIDGAYVAESGGTKLEIVLTSRRTDVRSGDARSWPASRDIYYYAPLDISDKEKTFDRIIEAAVAAGDIKAHTTNTSPDEQYVETDTPGLVLRDVSARTERAAAVYMRTGLPVFRRALAVIVNCICYLNTPRDHDAEASVVYPADAPPELAQKALARQGTASDRAATELLKLGYSRIDVLGGRISPSPRIGQGTAGVERSTHWRRGHWRRQPHGPARADRRTIWIMPVMVRPDRDDQPPGHIYRM
ncbi:MAG: hypothetical protein IBJ15_17010 [Alphaproteobacteria bacterium]|nr:hypothetical protein [Alphaproteobacteria bacterium]